jgi:hypothetical protein
MASTGIKGIDLYTKYNNKWRYVTTAGALVGEKNTKIRTSLRIA